MLLIFQIGRNLERKEMIDIIKISKEDAFYMRKNGYGEHVKKSKSKHPTYYLVEEPDTYRYDRKTHKRYVVHKGALNFYYDYRKAMLK